MMAILEDERDAGVFLLTMVANVSNDRILEKAYREITELRNSISAIFMLVEALTKK